ncbi:response regulator [Thalassotalea marina]|uniref:response regulator n=1 Tax=Thalassotalea marina TaxID=1673741 RepID=UPI0016782BC5|nr:response regulator [Thalassotalea marina]
MFIIGHEFIEDSIEDYQNYTKLYKAQSTIKPILLCDEFDLELANKYLEEKLVDGVFVARPFIDKERLQIRLKQAISKCQTTSTAYVIEHDLTNLIQNERPSILIIEDDDFFSEVYKTSLTDFELDIIVVADCQAASDAIYLNKPCLIFLDYNLPDFNGFEFLQSIKSDPGLSDIPVIVVTGDTDPELNKRSHQIGATKFLKKPLNTKDISTIANAILREQHLARS